MAEGAEGDRHSKAQVPDLITDPKARAEQEARNALIQFDHATEAIRAFTVRPDRPFRLRPSLILGLHRDALQGISAFAGNWRPAGVRIGQSKHVPPDSPLVPELIEEMCDYVNDNWKDQSAIQLAAYIMWRLNWVHPFDDGNGRTSRAVSYLVLCIRTGWELPGSYTIPEQISENKNPYYKALEAADEACKQGTIDVSEMADLLETMIAKQLAGVLDHAINPAIKSDSSERTFH